MEFRARRRGLMYPKCVGDLHELGWMDIDADSPTVVVGDKAYQSFMREYKCRPHVAILDGRSGGCEVIHTNVDISTTVYCNPLEPSPALNEAVFSALNSTDNSVIWVIGEEDVASSLVMLHAPDGVRLFFGSPDNNTIVGVICGRETRYIATTELFRKKIKYRMW